MEYISKKPKVFAVILNYNGRAHLLACLESLYLSDYPHLEVVVVDNHSTDGSLESAREKFSRFHFIKNSENLGFAAGNNVAIRFALEKMADYVFLLNNDALIEKNTLSKLVMEAENNSVTGILSPLIYTGDKRRVWFAGGIINWLRMKTDHLEIALSTEPYETDYISGCAMLIKKEVFKKIGLLDERFFLYYEDADFSFRAKRAGFSLKIVPSGGAFHFEQSESENPAKLYWLVISGIIFFQKNSSGLLKLWLNFYLLGRKIKNYYQLKRKPTSQARELSRAYRNYGKFLR